MPDIRLRQQVPASPDVAVGPPLPGWDIWLTGQVKQSPDLSVYPTRYLINDPLTGGTTYTLAASPGALTLTGASASLKVARVLTATPGTLTLSGGTASLTYTPAAGLPGKGPFQCGLFQPNVFQNDCTAATTTTDVGHVGRPSRPRRRHFVQVDGVDYEVRSQDEAVQVLTKLREIAQKRAQKAARKAVAKSVDAPVVKPIQATAQIDDYSTVWAQQLQAQVDVANAQVAQQYAAAVEAAQIWVRRQMAEQDDEDALIALGIL